MYWSTDRIQWLHWYPCFFELRSNPRLKERSLNFVIYRTLCMLFYWDRVDPRVWPLIWGVSYPSQRNVAKTWKADHAIGNLSEAICESTNPWSFPRSPGKAPECAQRPWGKAGWKMRQRKVDLSGLWSGNPKMFSQAASCVVTIWTSLKADRERKTCLFHGKNWWHLMTMSISMIFHVAISKDGKPESRLMLAVVRYCMYCIAFY